MYIAAKQLWAAGIQVLAAFAGFLGVLVVTLPAILIADCVALAGLWVINNLNVSSLPSLTLFTGSSNDSGNKPSGQSTGKGGGETTGSKQ